nr:ABC transporter permease subunit [Candidatus Cloacimonadota bacterium]
MSFNKALIVYRKELLEMMRDRRTLFATFIIPLILYPLLFIGFGSIMSRQTAVLEERGAEIAFADSVNNHISAAIIAGIKTNKGYNLLPYNQDTQGLYNSGNIQAIVSIGDSITAAGSSVYKVLVSYDSSKERNQLIYRKIKDSVTETKESSIATELSKRDVDPALMELIRVDAIDTSSAQKRLGSYLGMILPYIMIMMLVAGAATVAGDLVAGEKERRTLETLLVSSAQRNELVLGKYLTIITVAMVNVVVNLFSMGFSMQFLVGSQGIASSMTQMPVVGFLILLAAMLPLATLFAALLMSISTFSRNLKEAASYQQPVMMISMLLGMISFIPSVEINNLLALVPVVNIALLFKAVLINEYQLSHLLITVGSTLLLDIGAIWLTVKLF